MSVESIHTAAGLRREGNTYKALLADTRDLMEALHYATDEDRKAAQVQIEAINEVLTDGSPTG